MTQKWVRVEKQQSSQSRWMGQAVDRADDKTRSLIIGVNRALASTPRRSRDDERKRAQKTDHTMLAVITRPMADDRRAARRAAGGATSGQTATGRGILRRRQRHNKQRLSLHRLFMIITTHDHNSSSRCLDSNKRCSTTTSTLSDRRVYSACRCRRRCRRRRRPRCCRRGASHLGKKTRARESERSPGGSTRRYSMKNR